MIYWMTGLCASGKSTIARGVKDCHLIEVLDGDSMRTALCRGLGFSKEDRTENLRRIAHLAAHLNRHIDVIVACVTPYNSTREMVRSICDEIRIVYVRASLEECRRRDPKGLYAKAARGEISGFTGVDDPFEAPQQPDLVLDTENMSEKECIDRLLKYIRGEETKFALFVGRWQPFHVGHERIIREKLKAGEKVAIAVRNTHPGDGNPFPAPLTIEIIRAVFRREMASGDVTVFPIVDISSINVGRTAGYEVNTIRVPDDVGSISGTALRDKMISGESWEKYVPVPAVELLRGALGELRNRSARGAGPARSPSNS